MKKIISLLLVSVLCLSLFVSCNGTATDNNEKLSVVVTIFPEYDWVRSIMGEKFGDTDVTMLLDTGVDLHSFQPTAKDIVTISDCDLFIYVGGESDEWAEDALKQKTNENMVTLNLLDVLGENAKEEELKEGMEAEVEEEEGIVYDEHVWLSLKNAEVFCRSIADALSKIDPDNAAVYESNSESYLTELNNLDGEYQSAVDSSQTKTLLFADRFPFRYLTEDYGLDYFAAFIGCSAESEASFETISFLSQKVDELGLKNVMTLEGNDAKIANTVIQNTKDKNQTVLSLDSMQSITALDVENGVTYFSVMQKNLDVLKTALS